MMSQGRLVGSFLLLFLLSACGKANHGWEAFPVPIFTQQGFLKSSQQEADFREAMSFWSEKAGKNLFDYRGDWNPSQPIFAGDVTNPSSIFANVVFYQNPWPYAQNVVGETTVYSEDEKIKGAYIILNPYTGFCEGDCTYSNATSFRKTVTHELGHFLGLGHHGDVNNIMYPSSVPGGSLINVGVDLEALKALTHQEN